MCRLAAYLGPERPLADVVIAPSHSLLIQSQEALEAKLSVNGDGFGIAWYGDRSDPGLYKDVLPAWSDDNLLSLCHHIKSQLFLAHVRASTDGETARTNCHPYVHENWSFMHNGQTGSFSSLRRILEASLSDEFYVLRRGNTDSELIFLLLLNFGLAENPERACRQVIALLNKAAAQAKVKPFYRLTCVLSDGESLYCFRHASDGRYPSLYHSHQFFEGGIVIASEPMGSDATQWIEVTPSQLVRFRNATDMRSFDLNAA